MKAGRWQVVLNPYDWLPPYGESAIRFWSQGLDWVVEIEFDGDDDSNSTLLKRELRFESACAFYQASFPGPYLLHLEHDGSSAAPALGSLIEFPDSEAAKAWTQHFGGVRAIRHFQMAFLAENVVIEVFAKGVAFDGMAEDE